MPQIDFYLLTEETEQARNHYVCRLLDKAYHLKHRLYVHCADEKTAHLIDELLWTFQDESFIPHNLQGEGPEPAPPVQIGFREEPRGFNDILVNLSHDVPSYIQKFKRIIEVVHNEPTAKAQARDRFRYYKQQRMAIQTHDFSKSSTA